MSSIEYAPYGEPLNPGANPSPFGFTGEYTDPNGLVYLRNRYYDPVRGVFLSPDPLAQALGSPSNLYTYADANPVNYTDPSGLVAIDSCGLPPGLPSQFQTTEDRFYCNPVLQQPPNGELSIGHGVTLTVDSPSSVCDNPSDWVECAPGCWTQEQVEIVTRSVAAQVAKIGEENFRKWMSPEPNQIKIVMARNVPINTPSAAAIAPVPGVIKAGEYPAGPRRIIIYGNGNVTWADGETVIFSPELITHEFGHVISNEWAAREAEAGIIARRLSSRFYSNYYGDGSRGRLDVFQIQPRESVYLWEPFASGAVTEEERASGRMYDSRFEVEEFGAEAYAVWIYDKYASGSQQHPGSGLTLDQLVAAQKAFWEAIFSGSIQPGDTITPFEIP